MLLIAFVVIIYEPPIPERHTNELILIANSSIVDWQPEAINLAQQELTKRGVTVERQKTYISNQHNNAETVWQEEMERRKKEDYSLSEKLFMILTWPRQMLFHWDLKQKGYLLKAKRYQQMIALGILLTLLLFSWIYYNQHHEEAPIIETDEQIVI
jgi:hypothetical protein